MRAARHRLQIDWDFRGEDTRQLTHCFHDYPARMIPQIARKLLELFGTSAKKLLDPYCGTGTSLVEAQLRGIDAAGTDLNPLARLIAKVKTTPIRQQLLDLYLKDFSEFTFKARFEGEPSVLSIPSFQNIEFWFKPEVIRKLAYVKKYIWQIDNEDIRDFFKVAFSETVRESSLTRNSEFKLFRMPQKQMASFNPDVYGIIENKLSRNRRGMLAYLAALKDAPRKASVSIYDFNTVEGIPDFLTPSEFDLVITSPPYGDSHTTVAYGQYSRLSSQWMDFEEEANHVDKRLMGGQSNENIPTFDCKPLDTAIRKISELDNKRALEIASFYVDLEKSISNVSALIRRGRYVCYVVGNRRVKGTTLPTDQAIVSFFERNNFAHVDTFVRAIPNKRMPAKNSPTNEPGKLDTTMLNEYIIVMRKGK
jgi:site-specific DNA-methyltransferase (cytosine-N4-specific)